MNKKSLLLIFSILAVASCGLMGEGNKTRTDEEQNEIKSLLFKSFGERLDNSNMKYAHFRSCIGIESDNCNLILKHLESALDYQKKQNKIKNLEVVMTHLNSEQKQRPIKNRLDKAKKECPTNDKSYWETLPTEVQESLLEAATVINEEEEGSCEWGYINIIQRALDK